MAAAADRHLLFGLLALQTGIINQGQLVAAFQAWTLDKMRNLADILVARGDLNAVQRGLLEGLADQHLQKHGDVEKSLAAVPANRSTRASLAALGEPEIEATLARVARSKNGPATEPKTTTPTAPAAFPSARPPPTASGSASCGRMRGAAWGPSSWRSTASCTARWRSSRSSRSTPTTRSAASGSSPRPRSPAGSSTRASSPSTAWARIPSGVLTTRCGSSRVIRSRRRSTGSINGRKYCSERAGPPARRSLELRKLVAAVHRRLQRHRLRPLARGDPPRLEASQHHRGQARRDAGGGLGAGQGGGPGRSIGRRADASPHRRAARRRPCPAVRWARRRT